eukprot:gene12896-biopygen11025
MLPRTEHNFRGAYQRVPLIRCLSQLSKPDPCTPPLLVLPQSAALERASTGWACLLHLFGRKLRAAGVPADGKVAERSDTALAHVPCSTLFHFTRHALLLPPATDGTTPEEKQPAAKEARCTHVRRGTSVCSLLSLRPAAPCRVFPKSFALPPRGPARALASRAVHLRCTYCSHAVRLRLTCGLFAVHLRFECGSLAVHLQFICGPLAGHLRSNSGAVCTQRNASHAARRKQEPCTRDPNNAPLPLNIGDMVRILENALYWSPFVSPKKGGGNDKIGIVKNNPGNFVHAVAARGHWEGGYGQGRSWKGIVHKWCAIAACNSNTLAGSQIACMCGAQMVLRSTNDTHVRSCIYGLQMPRNCGPQMTCVCGPQMHAFVARN